MTNALKNILKPIGWIFLFVLILLTGLGIYIYFNAEDYLNKNLSRIVAEKSDNIYDLSFDRIELKVKPLSISVSGFSLIPNKERVDEIVKTQPTKTFFSLNSSEFKITHLEFLKLLRKKTFYCENLTVFEPEFSISGNDLFQNDSVKNMDNFFHEIQPLFNTYLNKVLIDKIQFIDANYNFYSSANSDFQISNAEKVSIEVINFKTDSQIIFNHPRYFESDDILVNIKSFRNNLSDSIHYLTIDTLGYSLKTSDIFARGFHLTHRNKDAQKNLYDVYVPYFHLKSKSISRLSLDDTLHIQSLNFDNPKLQFFQKEKQQSIQIEDIDKFNLYSLIEDQFDEIQIDSFFLTNADLQIYKQPDTTNFQQHFELLTIALNGFKLDSASSKNREKLFHSDDLEMSVKGYRLKLEDNQHEFSADSMFVSTIANKLGIKYIQISPINQEINRTRTNVNVNCQLLEIENVNLKTLYHTRRLPTRRISIINPEVKLQYRSEIALNKKDKEAGILFNLVSAYLKGVYSEVVEIEKGKLNIQTLKNEILKGYFETGFSFNLSGFALDSASMEQTDKIFYASNFDLEFNDYQMKLEDDLHKIEVDSISILSFDRKLQIENLRLKPVVSNIDQEIMKHYNRSEVYDISVPRITLWGINLRDAFFYNKLNIERFQVTKPEIYFENFGALREVQEKKEFSELVQLMLNYLYDLNVRVFSVSDGSFTWVNHTKKGKTTSFDNAFSATLKNLRFNENQIGKQRLFFSDNFEISLKDQVFQLSDSVHVLQAGEINLSSERSSIEVKNALLFPAIGSPKFDDLSTTFQVTIPHIQIDDFDYSKAYYSKELHFNHLELNIPKFEIYSKKGISKSLDLNKFDFPLPTFITSLQLNQFKINNGEVINYETVGLKQYAKSNFNINLSLPDVILKNDSENRINISTGNLIMDIYDFRSPVGKNHELKINRLDFNRNRKTLDMSRLEIKPYLAGHSGNRFSIVAPLIHFTDFNLDDAIRKNHFEFDEIKVIRPEIDIEIVDTVAGDKLEFAKNLDLFPVVEPYLNRIKIEQFQLENLDLNFNWFEKQIIDKNFNLKFNNIEIAEDVKGKNLLNSDEFEISTSNLKTKSKNGFYEFSADSLVYNSSKHLAQLKKISIRPILSRDKFFRKKEFQTDYLSAESDFMELRDLDENKWIADKIVDAKILRIGKTKLDIFRNKRLPFNSNQRPPWPQDLIKEIPQAFVFDSVCIEPSSITYSELLDLTDEPGYIEFTNFTFTAGQLSNIPALIEKDPGFNIKAKANLFDEGLLSVQMKFNLEDNNYSHTVSGSLQPMSLIPVNAMLERSTPVSIESGQLNQLDFDLAFNEVESKGKLFVGYKDFKVSVLQLNDGETKRSKLASFWVNNVVLNSDYPKGEKSEPIDISMERDPSRSIINFWWKTIFKGTKQAIGLDTEETNR